MGAQSNILVSDNNSSPFGIDVKWETALLESQRQEAWMTRYDDKREYKRYDLKAPVIYAYQDSDQFSKAQMCNYCEGGMCFETGNAIEPGSDLYIMMEGFSPDAIDAEFYDGYRAEVRWCRKTTLHDNEEFIVGVKYYKTIIT